jgi:hypothetical protein
VPAEYNRGLLSIFAETSAEDLIEVRNLKVQVLEEK